MGLTPTIYSSEEFPKDGRPFSIYMKLEQGALADLEVVATSSLALINALKDLADFADPMVEVKVTVQNGEEGSFRLNGFFKLFSNSTEESRQARQKTLNWLIAGAVYFILENTAAHYFDKFLNWVDERVAEAIEAGEEPEVAEAIANECRAIIEGAMRNDVSSRHVRRFYQEIRKDPNIVGVGLAGDHDEFPKVVVPRAEFLARSQPTAVPEEETRRERIERMTVLLVQPRLLGDDKAWRFSVAGIEFAAKVSDRTFIEDTLSGKNPIPLVEGVYLDVDMRIDERKVGDAWVIKSRLVQQVHGVQGGGVQGSLLGPVN